LGVDPIYLTVRATYANPDYNLPQTEGDLPRRTDMTHERHNLRPRTRAPYVFLEGALGGATFFKKVTVIVNGWSVEKEQMGDLHHMWQSYNRNMMTSERQRKKYNLDIPRVSTSFERKIDHPAAVVPPAGGMLDKLLLSMDQTHWEDNNTQNTKILRWGWDGEAAAAGAVAVSTVT
jgi:hypothetical protein